MAHRVKHKAAVRKSGLILNFNAGTFARKLAQSLPAVKQSALRAAYELDAVLFNGQNIFLFAEHG